MKRIPWDWVLSFAVILGNILVGDGTNVVTEVTMSGDVTIDNTGVAAIGSGVVVVDELLDVDELVVVELVELLVELLVLELVVVELVLLLVVVLEVDVVVSVILVDVEVVVEDVDVVVVEVVVAAVGL